MTDTELLPCPFCGGIAIVTSNGRQYKVWHTCQRVERVTVETDWHLRRGHAIAAWNRRANEATLGRVEVLAMALKHMEDTEVDE